jgi:hypothetical protein
MVALNTGTHHKGVPKDPEANRAWRQRLLAACLESQATRDAVKAMCREDVLFYVNTFAWTYRPKVGATSPASCRS